MTSVAESAPTGAPQHVRHDNRWIVLAIVCVGQLMVVLDATIVTVALPALQTDLGLSPENLQWVVNAYTLTFGGFLLLGGRLGDILGRRTVFVAGVVVFTLASLLCALSENETHLIVARALQGLGGALLSPAALSIIATEFDGDERAKALSVWGAIAGAGAAVGLLLGGILVEAASWEWIFLINLPIGVAVMAAALKQIAQTRADERPSHDVFGAITATGGLVLLVYGIVEAEHAGWTSGTTLLRGGIAIALLVAFLLIERRHHDPLVPLGIFRVRSVASANTVGLLAFAGIFAQFVFLSLFLQQVRGYSALETGLASLPFSITIVIMAGVASQVVPRIGVRRSAIMGTAIGAVGMVLFALVLDVDVAYFPGIIGPMVLLAIGMAFTFVPLTFLATSRVEPSKAGLASGLFNTTQQVGGALGLAILNTIAIERTARRGEELAGRLASGGNAELLSLEALVDGWSLAYLVGAGFIVLACLAAVLRVHDEDADLSSGAAAVHV